MVAPAGSSAAGNGSEGIEITRKVQLRNPAGLHARPCHAIARAAAGFESELRIRCGGLEVNGRSILELMTLCAPCHCELELRARGKDARQLIERLAKIVEDGFDEME
jgi:phosphotransferase system HPr (HPr) family protein